MSSLSPSRLPVLYPRRLGVEQRPKPVTKLSRRTFARAALAGAGGAALTGLSAAVSPGTVLGANERLSCGVIGVGGRGGVLLGELLRQPRLNVRVGAVSDVFQKRLDRARANCKGDGYTDYRKLLDRDDIDAVVVATPDHWHGKIAVDAMEAGKHVYLEKPMTHTIEQALAVRDTVRKFEGKRILQVGPNGAANEGYWAAQEAIRGGSIGKVTWAQASYNRNARLCLFNDHQRPDPNAGPEKQGENRIDWDLFLGHEFGLAPKIPWNPDHFFRFRKYWPYSGGVATDLLYHKLVPLLIAIAGADGEYPRRVTAGGGLYVEKDGRDIPDTFLATIDYPSEFSVFLVSTLTNDLQITERIYGKHGTIDLGGEPWLRPNGPFEAEFKTKNGGETDVRLPARSGTDMLQNFVDVIRGKSKRLFCNAELGTAAMVAIRLAVDAYRTSRPMEWDAEKERVRAGS